jgi:putative DNA primase/helicase
MTIHHPPLPPAGEAALEYAARGWHVFPSPPGKKLGYADFAQDKTGRRWGATDDPDELRRMFMAKPEAGVCITTGPESGIFVIEGDCKGEANGNKWLADEFAAHGELIETVQALSPSSSWHIYFRWPEGMTPKTCEGEVAPGVDVRGHGGMVVAAPSTRPGASQPYRWKASPDRFQVMDCPDWLLAKVPMKSAEKTMIATTATGGSSTYRDRVANLTVEGRRHSAVRSISQTLANKGVAPGLTESLLGAICPTYDANARKTVASAYAKAAAERDAELTEDGVALAFTARFGGELRFDHDQGRWFRWTGDHWKADTSHLAFSYCRDIARELAKGEDARTRATLGKASFAAGVEKLARADRAHAVTSEAWDGDPYLLGCPGAAVDLRTGTARPPDPAHGITKLAAVAPGPGDCPLWRGFLRDATGGDAEMVEFLRRWCGYCLTGDTREHALIFLYGPGGNGKSVFLNTVTRLMGDYATTAAMDTFTSTRGDKHPTELAMLRGARLVAASETEEGRAWAEARIKQMTGGDQITARFMRQDFFSYVPQFKLTIVGNHAPALATVDDAARRRFNIVPFVHKPANPDRELEAKLEAEWPAILRWMVEGAVAWRRDGLARPESVKAATADYFAGQDLTKQWLDEACELRPGEAGEHETAADLYASWCAYAKASGEEPGSAKALAPRLRRHGLREGRGTRGVRIWRGVRIKREGVAYGHE